jgi:EAL domain-containing protein (putative c-di-GMP-specific phosphodiesterase class I)
MDGEAGTEAARAASAEDGAFDIAAVIEAGSVESRYQPIVSTKGGRVVGLEALARAVDPNGGKPIAPGALFAAAAREGLSLELDRLCRRRAVEGFAASEAMDSDAALFMNVDTSIIDSRVIGSNMIRDLVESFCLDPGRVVIELLESEIRDERALMAFVERYHGLGFMIALDDVGAGHSNMERIVALKPDIVKIDGTLISGIEGEFYKQELLDFFVKLTSKLGVLTIAEGVETEEAALACLSKGADLMQGFHLGRPGRPDASALEACLGRAREALAAHKKRAELRIPERRARFKGYESLASRVCEALSRSSAGGYDEALADALAWFVEVECAYVLDARGTQVSSTVFNPARRRRKASAIYSPSVAGDDQSAKDYFLFLDGTSARYISEPYVSRASGAVCVTISAEARDRSGTRLVLCLDIDLDAAG